MFFSGYLYQKANYDFRGTTKTTHLDSPKIYDFSSVNTTGDTTKKLTIFNQNTILNETQIDDNKSIAKLKIDLQKTKKKLKGFFIKTKTGNKLITLNHETKI